jgi:hypothetical protein
MSGMLKSAFISSLLLLSYTLYGQSDLADTVLPPYNDEYSEFIFELSKSFAPDSQVDKMEVAEETWKHWTTVENFTFGKDRGNLPMITDLNALHPYFRDKVISLIAMCKAKGIELTVVETYRTHAKQNEYKAMGTAYTRTSGGKSKHQYGLAIDLVPVINSVPQWDNAKLWRKVGAIGEQLGLRWGGRWKSLYDPGHFEWTGGLSSYHLSNGQWPLIPKANKYPCLEEDLIQLTENWKAWETEQSAITRKETATNKMN